MFNWFNATDAVAQGKEIALSVSGLLGASEAGGIRRAEGKIREKFERLIERSTAAVRGRRFNLYQKAKFANTLKWELREAGYPDEFIDEFLTFILVRTR
ncbi:MAG: hypothetical protein HY017_01920 [Betaproteobacteria bacterium]|nr:hypothetical protein [Betaproteobacteria bacterium]